MADKKISAMTALTSTDVVGTDVIPILDLSEADASKNKKITVDDLKKQGTVFTDLPGLAWDGTYKTKTLSANTALTFSSTQKAGILRIKQDATGSRTLSINGTAITINTAANAVTYITAIYNEVLSEYDYIVDLNVYSISGGGGDLTPPSLVSAVVRDEDPTKVRLTYDETLNSGSTPSTGDFTILKNGVSAAKVGVGVSGTICDIELFAPAISTDVFVISYTPGTDPLQDMAGNLAAALTSQAVTNNVVGGYDADAITVITAIEATDAGAQSTGVKDAINARIVALKAQGKWANMKAYYGYVGGTANSHRINWKSPGTFDITWAGGITHSATGVLFNGTTGYGDTGLNDNTVLTLDEVTIGGYSRTSTNNGFMMGALSGNGLYLADRNSMIIRLHDVLDLTQSMTPTRTIIAARQTAAPKVGSYRDGVQLTVDSGAALGKINLNVYVGAINSSGSAAGFSDKQYASHFIYNGGFTAAEVTTFTTDENTFQTALSRNV